MRVVITHLTRMKAGSICVAGIAQQTREHIRPEWASGQLPRSLLRSEGGLFAIGSVVNLLVGDCIGKPPMVEDYLFDPEASSYEGQLTPNEFWDLLSPRACSSLRDIFGPSLTRGGRTCYVPPGEGSCSLGYFKPSSFEVNLEVYPEDNRYRLGALIQDPILGQLNVAITDLRFYEEDQKMVNINVYNGIMRSIAKLTKAGLILGVGLSRPRALGGHPEGHWLQVNNIHFRLSPLWEPGNIL